MFFLLLFLVYVGVRGYRRRTLGGILCETPELLIGLENVTRANIVIGLRSKWVNYRFNKITEEYM